VPRTRLSSDAARVDKCAAIERKGIVLSPVRIHRVLQISPLCPQPPDAERLGVEERQVTAVVAGNLHDPAALREVLVVLPRMTAPHG
jgi:hypothetical protein